MSVRFAQLPIGASFRWQSGLYRKVSPLEATDLDAGERRLVPRSARVESADAAATTTGSAVQTPQQRLAIELAVDSCIAQVRQRMAELTPALDRTQAAALQTALRNAGEDLADKIAMSLDNRPIRGPTKDTRQD